MVQRKQKKKTAGNSVHENGEKAKKAWLWERRTPGTPDNRFQKRVKHNGVGGGFLKTGAKKPTVKPGKKKLTQAGVSNHKTKPKEKKLCFPVGKGTKQPPPTGRKETGPVAKNKK